MNRIIALAVAASIALAACQTTTNTPATKSISNQAATVVDGLNGKRLVADNCTTFIINADGTMGESLGGEPVVGSYEANANESCSLYTSPKRLVGSEFCSTPVVTGNTLVFNRCDGSTSTVYTIKG